MKFLKILFSRMTIVILFIVLQVVLMYTMAKISYDLYLYAPIVIRVISVIAIIGVFNRKMMPEAKMTWILFIAFSPIFGTLCYIIFSKNRVPKKERKLFAEVYGRHRNYYEREKEEQNGNREMLGNYRCQSDFICQATGMAAHNCTYAHYIPSGEEFLKELLKELNEAKKYIFIEFFILDEGEMWDAVHDVLVRKVKEGVEVRLVYDYVGCAGKLPAFYFRKLRKEGIQCYPFNPIKPIISAIYNNRSHRKIVVIDGKTGFTGGANLGDEYINRISPYGHWKDSAIMLKGEGVTPLVILFMQNFATASKKAEDVDSFICREFDFIEGSSNLGWVQPFGDGPKLLFGEHIAKGVYVNMIESAEKYIYITTPYLIPDSEITSALKRAVMRGVDVRIVVPAIPDKKIAYSLTESNCADFTKSGVKIYKYQPGFIHAKNFLCDGNVGVVGTINLDYRSLVHHFECGVWLYASPCLIELEKDFDDLFEESCLLDKDFQPSIPTRIVASLMKVVAPLM